MRIAGIVIAAVVVLGGGAFYFGVIMSSLKEAAHGQLVYFDHCAVCHAPDGSGVEYQGLPLISSTFMEDLTDEELKTFIMVGRAVDAPDSRMEDPMLPVDYLEEAEYTALIRHLRGLSSQ